MGRAVKRLSLTFWIVFAMAAGILTGVFFPNASRSAGISLLATIFLRLIRSIIAPLLFGSLVAGLAGSGSLKTMGRVGIKALVYFEAVTTLALAVGLAAVNIARPGAGVQIQTAAPAPANPAPISFPSLVEHAFPASIAEAMARGDVLEIVVFALLFGAAASAAGAKARPVVDFCSALAETMFRYTRYVMYTAPFGVFGALAAAIGKNGPGVLLGLGKLLLTLYAALAVFVLGVLLPVALLARVPLRPFLNAVREPFLIAFSTSASEAALPLALENMETFGVPNHIAAFVIPAGYSFNLDGSTLYLALAAMFVAQAANAPMPLSRQLALMVTLMLTSKGVGGVPRAALVILAGTLASFQLPAEGVAVLLGADVLLDMVRTSVNVLGNCLASAVVARWEGVKLPASPAA
jgi:proton glutamate symport protein